MEERKKGLGSLRPTVAPSFERVNYTGPTNTSGRTQRAGTRGRETGPSPPKERAPTRQPDPSILAHRRHQNLAPNEAWHVYSLRTLPCLSCSQPLPNFGAAGWPTRRRRNGHDGFIWVGYPASHYWCNSVSIRAMLMRIRRRILLALPSCSASHSEKV